VPTDRSNGRGFLRRRRADEAKRVLVLVQNLPYQLDRRVRLECTALVRSGYQVSVICPKGVDTPSTYERDGVRVHSYRPAPPTSGVLSYVVEFVYAWLRTAMISMRLAVTEGFDVIQACNPPDTYWALALLYRPFGKKFVYDQHDLCPEVYRARFGRDDGRCLAALYRLERWTYRWAHHVISTNESYKAVAVRRGGVSPELVTVVRSGPDASKMRKGDAVDGLRKGREHLAVYLGVMGPQDGVDYLLRAIHHYVHDLGRVDTQFALLGFGDALPSLRSLSTELDIDEFVTFTGRADDAMINDYLSTATVGLSPDPSNPLNDVSTMNKTLEYMAYELPVVAFELPETVVSAGPAAVYVPDNDEFLFAKAVAELLGDGAERARMGHLGRRRIEERLAWVHQEISYVGVYDELFDRPRASRAPVPGIPQQNLVIDLNARRSGDIIDLTGAPQEQPAS
jgi:glycosyltransferase involved in cell wall biosynthesis